MKTINKKAYDYFILENPKYQYCDLNYKDVECWYKGSFHRRLKVTKNKIVLDEYSSIIEEQYITNSDINKLLKET